MFLICVSVALLVPNRSTAGELIWQWEAEFTTAERSKIESWLQQTHAAVERYAGPFPFPVRLLIHRRDGAGEPVPWANTWRGEPQSINFHVNADYAEQDFLDDWTGPHEFAHLLLPYLGRDNSWYAEGFASYLQHSIMVELGVIDEAEARRRRGLKIDRAVSRLEDADEPMLMSIPDLKREHSYPTMYWGGALYFERVDARLQEEGSSLQGVIAEFLRCCRMQRRSLDELTAVLDATGSTKAFSIEMDMMRKTPGVPARP